MIKSQYENTTGLSVLESGILLERELTNRVLIATMLGLALKNQFTIRRMRSESSGVVNIELFRNGSQGDQSTLDRNEKLLLGILFNNFRDDRILFSDIVQLRMPLPFDARTSISDNIIHRLLQKGLLRRGRLRMRAFTGTFFVRIFLGSVGIYLAFLATRAMWVAFPLHEQNGLLFALFLSFAFAWLAIGYFFTKDLVTLLHLTKEGADAVDALLGYREYLLVAEKDRIDFHESPDAETRMLTKHLPYAVLFGVEQAWLKKISA